MTRITLRRVLQQGMLCVVACVLALSAPAGAQNPQEPDPDRYIVKFVDAARGRAALTAAGAAVVLDLPIANAAAARIPSQALQALANNPNIEYIEPDVPRYPYSQTTPYGIGMVQADRLSDANASNRTVCIIDSGYSVAHGDLPPSGVAGSTEDWRVDNCGHGTHVAGTVAAVNNSIGVLGVLPNVNPNLYIVKVFDDSCSWAYSSTLVHAAQQCRDAGANVISMSLGGRFASTTERSAFQTLYDQGILSAAAAGNGGNTQKSYPASYDSVISVAAVDSAEVAASFSQRNDQVELAGPGVAVRSTVTPGAGKEESLTVGSDGYEVVAMEGSPNLTGSGVLVDCGLGTSTCAAAAGNVCLIQRGTNSFAEKVLNCQNGGGAAAVIYNNEPALFSGTLGSTGTSIPSVGTSGVTGEALRNLLGSPSTVTVQPGDYAFYDGTSMATPHVSAVAALIWSHNTTWTNQEVRDALALTAKDKGSAGRDNTYGFGIVQAKGALDLLQAGAGGGGNSGDGTSAIELSATGKKIKGSNAVNLSWSGATNVIVYRDASPIATVNGTSYTDSTGTKGGGWSFTYKVCSTADTSMCSNEVTIVF